MKRALLIILAIALILSLAACGDDKEENNKPTEASSVQADNTPTLEQSAFISMEQYADLIRSQVESSIGLDDEVCTGKIYAESSNVLTYEYTMREQYTGEDYSFICDAISELMVENEAQYKSTAKNASEYTGIVSKLHVVYKNADGSVIKEGYYGQ